MRYFTFEEAQALIPELERIFKNALEIHAKTEDKARRVLEFENSGNTLAHELNAIRRPETKILKIKKRLSLIFKSFYPKSAESLGPSHPWICPHPAL